ncbi:hypothetical protein GFS24_18415 [Chitinophaga sp. SYP-B3965]|uniref:hypothetical protein n=1 Tax=Chitinophaga sp. SYP-B3965 TaxID=2663120 RepID=UPI001299ECB9|nr:hypothetical protein [Chitinophaga sp. SYP-B3965]MRG47103.1 hypothetical protein [Chitinophaga sp. SYP-B3965]
MKKSLFLLILITSCIKNKDVNKEDKFFIVTNGAAKSHFSTLNTLNHFPTSRNPELALSPIVRSIGEDLFILEPDNDSIKKYHRFPNGDITERGVLRLVPATGASDMIIVSDRLGYSSLKGSAKIMAWDPSTMAGQGTVDISSFGISDADPDATLMAFSNGKLFVVCNQRYSGKTVPSPAQVLIIDTKNGNAVTSVTDDRGAYTDNTTSAVFFTENGDFYLYCGADKPEQNGFLRIKNGQSSFDVDYFFGIGAPGTIDHLSCSYYAGSNILFSMGALTGSQQFGAFSINLIDKKVTKIDLPASTGYAGNIFRDGNNLYFGLSTSNAKGFYEYEMTSGKAGIAPKINTTNMGDPWLMGAF